jgi:hypothetical protein
MGRSADGLPEEPSMSRDVEVLRDLSRAMNGEGEPSYSRLAITEALTAAIETLEALGSQGVTVATGTSPEDVLPRDDTPLYGAPTPAPSEDSKAERIRADSGKRLLEEHAAAVRSWEAKWLQEKMNAKSEMLTLTACTELYRERVKELELALAAKDKENTK